MYVIQNGFDEIVMVWDKVLPNGNYDYDDMIHVLQEHKDELGIDRSDDDISEIVNVDGIEAINDYMNFGKVEFFGINHWYKNGGV